MLANSRPPFLLGRTQYSRVLLRKISWLVTWWSLSKMCCSLCSFSLQIFARVAVELWRRKVCVCVCAGSSLAKRESLKDMPVPGRRGESHERCVCK
ncbi:hypothetical protein EJ05DRAFT_86820 [Pseudovirgaria hyperparasitica]|uniref:Uncharacterized protein n=1 Tax=Pseudovirgaria hyperparasitica TaxID=470096 RepID=A0A6A6VZD1_9PEZI|nr:uncharacterized protein EJ05DRAFT_86820 [Pseudovirgaria hyperparasitica]KAF2756028.1 hypothetical protein EJ05DRAFT_86820 [Pseudovirgaria hyperparasitica]